MRRVARGGAGEVRRFIDETLCVVEVHGNNFIECKGVVID
jgi:hypothetical protein